MNVTLDPSNAKRCQVMLTGNSADVFPDALLDLLLNKVASFFSAEDDVIEELRVCVCHMGECFNCR